MATTTSYVDIGALQRPNSGSGEVIDKDYIDIGAVQAQEQQLNVVLDPLLYSAPL